MSKSQHKIFKSKVDAWVAISFIALLVAPLFIFLQIDTFSLNEERSQSVLVTAGVSVLVMLLVFSLRYEVSDNTLYIKSFLYKKTIPIKNIRKVTSKRGWLSAPAMSSKRLVIHYSTGSVEISPKDVDAFLEAINQTISNSL